MADANISLNSNSIGVKVTAALVVLGLVVEVLSDNFTMQAQGIPMTVEACSGLCVGQGETVERVEAWACQCRPVVESTGHQPPLGVCHGRH